jgi:hypothetical protein
LPASATPISHDEQGIDASPTLVDQGLQVSATPLATLLVSATPIFEATHPNFPYYNLDDVLCTAIVDVPPSANRPNASLGLTSRPGNTWTIVGGITNGTTVDILDQTNFPGGTGVWQGAPLNYYFVSSTNTLYPIQGWIQEFFVEFTSECPPLPVYEADYWRAGIESQTDSTVIQGGLPETLTPPDATAAAATQQSYYSDLSTAVAGTVEAMIPPTGTLIPTATSNTQAGNPSVRRENVVVTDAQITMTHFTEPVHLTVTGYHADLCQYATVINQRQDETHITVEIYRELPREVGCFDELVDYEATIPLGIFPQAATYTVDINGYTTEFVVEGQAPTATFTTLPTQNSSLPSTGDCVLATIGSTPVNVRSAPTTNSTIVGTIFPDLLYGVVGRNADSTWWNINPEIPGAVSGWVSASVTRLGGDCSNVLLITTSDAPADSDTVFPPTAIVPPPPTLVSPTPLPTGLITPTFCADC